MKASRTPILTLGASARAALARPVEAPHFFEVVELPYLGPKNVDDNIGTIYQNPLAIPQAFDARRLMVLALERADNTLSNRPDVNVGASACDDHSVGKDGFAVQVDCDDVLGLRIVETCQDSLHKWSGFERGSPRNRVERWGRRFR
jgi:hypothetical protein